MSSFFFPLSIFLTKIRNYFLEKKCMTCFFSVYPFFKRKNIKNPFSHYFFSFVQNYKKSYHENVLIFLLLCPFFRNGASRLQPTLSLGTMRHQNSKYLSSNTDTSKTLLQQPHHGKDKTYGFFREVSQTSPRRNNQTLRQLRSGAGRGGTLCAATSGSTGPSGATVGSGAGGAATMRPTSSSMSSYTISGSCSSSNSNNSNGTSSSNSNNAYGFANFNHIGNLTSGKGENILCTHYIDKPSILLTNNRTYPDELF